jgi:hypothetical protein
VTHDGISMGTRSYCVNPIEVRLSLALIFLLYAFGTGVIAVALATNLWEESMWRFLAALPFLIGGAVCAGRAMRVGLYLDKEGLNVHNVLKRRRFAWSEIDSICPSTAFIGGSRKARVFGVVVRGDGQIFPLLATVGAPRFRYPLAERLRLEANEHGFEVEVEPSYLESNDLG